MSGQTIIFALVSLVLLVIVLVLRRQRDSIRRLIRRMVEELDGVTGMGDEGDELGMEVDDLCGYHHEAVGVIAKDLRDLRQDRGLLQAILTSMTQSVIALDSEERVLSLNSAACELLDTNRDWAVGRCIQEILRSPALQGFVRRIFANSEYHTEEELSLPVIGVPDDDSAREFVPSNRILFARGQGLYDVHHEKIGILLVLSDITQLRRLEQVRQDFVANVSHELRTPITAIRGSVETLLDGGDHDDETTARFLAMIDRHADRLDATLEDLLCLARLDAEPKFEGKKRVAVRCVDVVNRAVEACEVAASHQGTTIHVTGDDEIQLYVDNEMMEQALINLIANAIKYSPEGGDITVGVERSGADGHVESSEGTDEIVFSVTDRGIGIPRDHHARIFERFYRVDKGRSRDVGGTGLGLSIVKHVALTHGGRVSVESEPGIGSVFRIHLPSVPGPTG